jgi:hypothetical protein
MANMRVVLTKEFTFRGRPERYSNGYTFTGGTASPTNAADVSAAVLALINIEKAFHAVGCKFVYAYGGQQGSDAVYVEEFASPQVGLLSEAQMHPETVILLQAKIARRRYLTKYFHTGAHIGGSGVTTKDAAPTGTFKTTIESNMAKLTDGTFSGGMRACAPNGALPVEPFLLDPYLRTHQLKARGKRPTAA